MELVPFSQVPAVEEPWSWAFTFVLLGWGFFLCGCFLISGSCITRIWRGTRRAIQGVKGACQPYPMTSSRTRAEWERNTVSVGVQTVALPPREEEPPADAVSPHKDRHCCTPRRMGCVYSTHPRQAGSPDLVKIMACRARPVLQDLAKGSRTASSEWESCHPGHR